MLVYQQRHWMAVPFLKAIALGQVQDGEELPRILID